MSTVAETAIARSAETNEIVTLGSPLEAIEGWREVMAELFAECEDCAETDQRSAMAEYWGTTEDGHTWRVHVWQGSHSDGAEVVS